jgi:Flp pilus assembly protein TadG
MTYKHRHRVNCWRIRQGATAVEFALVVPIIFALFIGAIEMTRMNFIRHSAANAAYEGARAGIVIGGENNDCSKAAKDLLKRVGVKNDVDVQVTSDATSVTVTVSVPVDKNSWGLGRFTSGFNITQACHLSKDGF